MSKDLRSFIKQVATTMPDQIQMITEEVDAKFGITAVAGRLAKEGKFPALYPVPQNAPYLSAGMNVLNSPKGKPKSHERKSVVRGLLHTRERFPDTGLQRCCLSLGEKI